MQVWHNSVMAKEETQKEETATEEEVQQPEPPKEIGGRKGPDPTRYGDWEKNGRCIDF